jgi:hypothetical protein
VSTGTRDALILAVALFAVAAFAYYYVAGVLEGDRLVSRSAAVAVVLFGVVAVVFLVRIL